MRPEEGIDPLMLELQAVVSDPAWMLGNKLGVPCKSSKRL